MTTKILDYKVLKQKFINKKSWGLLTSIDLYKCNHQTLSEKGAIEKYVIALCDKIINVKRFGDPIIVKFGDDPKVTGYSMCQLIESSLVSGHFAESTDAIYIDIFSCAPYDAKLAIKYTKKYFEAKECKINIIFRY